MNTRVSSNNTSQTVVPNEVMMDEICEVSFQGLLCFELFLAGIAILGNHPEMETINSKKLQVKLLLESDLGYLMTRKFIITL